MIPWIVSVVLALLTSIFYKVWNVISTRERDEQIVARNAGGMDISDWWQSFQEPGIVLRKSEQERLR